MGRSVRCVRQGQNPVDERGPARQRNITRSNARAPSSVDQSPRDPESSPHRHRVLDLICPFLKGGTVGAFGGCRHRAKNGIIHGNDLQYCKAPHGGVSVVRGRRRAAPGKGTTSTQGNVAAGVVSSKSRLGASKTCSRVWTDERELTALAFASPCPVCHAEYFRDEEKSDVYLFIDKFSGSLQAGSEVSALLGTHRQRCGLSNDARFLKWANPGTYIDEKGSITSFQAVVCNGDDLTASRAGHYVRAFGWMKPSFWSGSICGVGNIPGSGPARLDFPSSRPGKIVGQEH